MQHIVLAFGENKTILFAGLESKRRDDKQV